MSSEELAARLRELPSGRRSIIAIAGAPGSGKSTLAERLARGLDQARPGRAAVLAMDGYHYDDAVLRQRGRLERKGAPDTFDVGGLRHTLRRLRAADEEEVAVPVFDRTIEIARAGGLVIPRSIEIIVVEGNYLLLEDSPWNSLAACFDHRAMILVAEDTLRRRLTDRWRGLGLSEPSARAKVEHNDLPNGRFVRERSAPADWLVDGED